jgi:hypothetical protein
MIHSRDADPPHYSCGMTARADQLQQEIVRRPRLVWRRDEEGEAGLNRCTRAAAAVALALACQAGTAQPADPIPVIAGPLLGPVASEHRAAIAGAVIPYRAVFREYELK